MITPVIMTIIGILTAYLKFQFTAMVLVMVVMTLGIQDVNKYGKKT